MLIPLIIAVGFFLYFVLKETFEKPMPKDAYFDYDEYWKDINDQMDINKRMRKLKNMKYYKSPSNPNWNK